MRSLIALVLLTTPVWAGELPSSEGALPIKPSTPKRSEMLRQGLPGTTFNYEQCVANPAFTRENCLHARHCLTSGSTKGECEFLYRSDVS